MKNFLTFFLLGFIFLSSLTDAVEKDKLPLISEKTIGMKKYSGFINFYWDKNDGKIWLEIDKFDKELLYVYSLSQGIGSNDIGLDRGQIGNNLIVKFERIGPKVLMIEPNYSYRAENGSQVEKKTVEESFAKSVLWGFKIEAEENGKVLVDASDFFFQDMHDVIGTLKRTKQGNYKIDQSRSAFYLDKTKNFPKNSEIETIITYTGDAEGEYVNQVVPFPKAITVHEHYSFVELPDDGYKPRVFDPRAGYFDISFTDYSTPLGQDISKKYIVRHNLKKKNPNAEKSEPVKPLIYYVDNGAPEPIRSALIEGASWWNEAFEAAGFTNAFQVKVLPDSVDPMDVRYNVIQWVHRSTRGWSYGGSVFDPRTGEVIQGRVTLGSLRVRQDYLIAEGILAPYKKGEPVSDEMKKMALARIRQLAAHEVGHTLGLAHNFSASISNRASVMDYPFPLIKIKDKNTLDLSDAYASGVGEWDKIAIEYGYTEFKNPADEKNELNKIINKAFSKGLMFISDEGARPLGSANPYSHLWDNGANPVDELNRIMEVRKIVLNNFSENNIKEGEPFADLENVLVPIYLLHRFQLQAAAKSLGGLFYTYALRGDGQKITEIVSADQQRKSLDALLKTIQPDALEIPERILKIIPPQPTGYERTRENFESRTGLTFDPLSAAESAADLTIQLILQPERAGRLLEYNTINKNNPGLIEVINQLLKTTWKAKRESGTKAEIQRVVDNVVLQHLFKLANNEKAIVEVKAIALMKIKELKEWLSVQVKNEKDEKQKAHFIYAILQIEKFEKNPEQFKEIKPIEIPAGQPIGEFWD